MTVNAKSFLIGFVAAAALSGVAAIAFDGFCQAMIRSKSKRLLADSTTINRVIVKYRAQHGAFPSSKGGLVGLLPRMSEELIEYQSDGRDCILVYPSSTSAFRWDPYVFHNGTLTAWPRNMDAYVNEYLARPN